jgi:hypothetical protein
MTTMMAKKSATKNIKGWPRKWPGGKQLGTQKKNHNHGDYHNPSLGLMTKALTYKGAR